MQGTMNRDDLKYRVWDNQVKRYLSFDGNDDGLFLLPDAKLWGGKIGGCIGCHAWKLKEYEPTSYVVERCTGFTDNYEIPIYEKDRIKIENPIKGIEQDTEYCVGWIKGCWYALGAHGMQRLSELLENHSVLVLGTIHDKEQHEQKENVQ